MYKTHSAGFPENFVPVSALVCDLIRELDQTTWTFIIALNQLYGIIIFNILAHHMK